MRSFKEWLLQNPIFKMLVPDSTFLGLLHYNAEEMEVAKTLTLRPPYF